VLLLALILAFKNLPAASKLMMSGSHASWLSVQTNDIWSVLAALFGIGRSPVVYQFWFLRDLIVANIFSFCLIRPFPACSVVGWIAVFVPIPLVASLGFFLAGFSLHRIVGQKFKLNAGAALLFMLVWLGVGGAFLGSTTAHVAILQLGSALWLLCCSILLSSVKVGQSMSHLGHSVFFVYATHEPLQTMLTKAWRLLGFPLYESLVRMLLVPAVTFALCLLAYFFARRCFPRLLALATGGR
jgi:hypothetical protein